MRSLYKQIQDIFLTIAIALFFSLITLLTVSNFYISKIEAKEKFHQEKVDEILFELDYLKYELEQCQTTKLNVCH